MPSHVCALALSSQLTFSQRKRVLLLPMLGLVEASFSLFLSSHVTALSFLVLSLYSTALLRLLDAGNSCTCNLLVSFLTA